MASITIKDLPESVDLDRQAMVAITGGARLRGRANALGRPERGVTRIVKYPGGAPDRTGQAKGKPGVK